ncbi:MAG: N-methyl-L-tryptophan oxidase [Chloroflexi bacterium]|nr:N-methyl-L-tryptophan oxidase [Chloroflexota bacterium]MYJ93240.1 N-methyl-L-tryptophan oxidase [Chloroflexota bacterium]
MTTSTNRYDVAIIGLGAMGSAAAWHLARRGQRVIGFDRFHPPHMMGSTHGDTRGIREAYYEGPSYVPFVRRAYELWDELSGLVGQQLFTQTGALSLGVEGASLVEGVLASAREHDIAVDYMDSSELKKRYPGVMATDDLVGVLEQRGGMIEIEPALNGQLDQAARHGAELHFDEPVDKWLPQDMDDIESPVTINTAKGTYEAERMVVTAGAWNAGLLGKLNLPLMVTRQVMFWFEPKRNPEAFEVGALPFWMWERGPQDFAYGFPNVGKGFKLGHHQPLDEVEPSGYSRELTERDESNVRYWLERTFPDVGGKLLRAETCLYTHTPDAHFLLDIHPKRPNIVVASPCSGHGFKFAPAIGEALADLSMHRKTEHDLELFRIDRFVEPLGAQTAAAD